MFTQKITMNCTKEQYEKYLKEELDKMGYEEFCVLWGDIASSHVITNCFCNIPGFIGSISHRGIKCYARTYLSSFNPDLFLALAAMTDKDTSEYGEWLIGNRGEYVRNNDGESWINFTYWRKATVEEIMAKFGKQKPITLEEEFHKLQEEVNLALKKIKRVEIMAKIKSSDDIPSHKSIYDYYISNPTIRCNCPMTNPIKSSISDQVITSDILNPMKFFQRRTSFEDNEEFNFKKGDYLTAVNIDGSKLIGILSGKLFRGNDGFPILAGLNFDNKLFLNDTFGLQPNFTIRYSTHTEILQLGLKLAEQGKMFDKEKCELVDIPKYKEPVIGEMAIFWDSNKAQSICRLYIKVRNDKYVDFCDTSWENAILYESPEQYKNFLKEQ